MLNEAFLEAATQLHRGRSAVANDAAGTEITGQPCTRSCPFQAPVPRGGWRQTIHGTLRPHQLRRQPEHQAGLGLGSVKTLPQFSFGNQSRQPVDTAPEETGQHRHLGTADPQLTGCHLKQRDLAAVGVEQNQTPHALVRQLFTHPIHKRDQQVRRQAQGAGERRMLRGESDRLDRQPPDGKQRIQTQQHRIENPLGEQGIGGQRQLRSVLFTGTKGPDHGGSRLLHGCSRGRPAEVIESAVPRRHRHPETQFNPRLAVRMVV